MDIATLIGLFFGVGMLVLGDLLEGGNPLHLLLFPPFVIVMGGTIGMLLVLYPMNQLTRFPEFFGKGLKMNPTEKGELIEIFVKLSQKARSEGLLSLEETIQSPEYAKVDPFIIRGIKLVVDGTPPELIRDILDIDIHASEEHDKVGAAMFEAMGGASPTMGIIGTVMGLVKVLSNLSDRESLAESIASAFIATLYGVAFANLVFLPMGGNLKAKVKEDKEIREMMVEAILSIQVGENPAVLKEKLLSFLVPHEREAFEKREGSGKKGE